MFFNKTYFISFYPKLHICAKRPNLLYSMLKSQVDRLLIQMILQQNHNRNNFIRINISGHNIANFSIQTDLKKDYLIIISISYTNIYDLVLEN
jgi:hypothetical protein